MVTNQEAQLCKALVYFLTKEKYTTYGVHGGGREIMSTLSEIFKKLVQVVEII
jgi:hypothetical protein